jgi:DNA-binding beta-propeller fold protein YncE
MTSRRTVITTAVLALVACGSPSVGAGNSVEKASIAGYHVVGDLPLPGNTSRWDYQVLDPASHRLYIAHLGASEVVVFDIDQQRVVGVVKGVNAVHGLALAPELGRLFASATGTNELVGIDLKTLAVVGRTAAGEYPDGLDYVPGLAKLYVSDEQGSGDTIVDARTVQHVGSIDLGSDIGNTKYDPSSGFVYVAVGGSNQIEVVDPRSDRVTRRLPIPGCGGAHGLQLVPSTPLAFVGCEANNQVVALNLSTGRVLGTVSIGNTPDVLAYDSGMHLIYAACEDGTLWVIQAAGGIKVLSHGNAGPHAHTVAVDSSTHLVYLPLTDVGGRPVLRILSPDLAAVHS